MFRSLQHAFVCLFSPSSFFLLVCLQQGSPMITVDKFNVPEPRVQTQEGFWSAAVDFFQH